jgi:translocator protein
MMTITTPAIAAILWSVILGGVGGLLTEIGPWYRALKKPSFQPPDWAFGPAWSIILGLAGWAAYIAYTAATTDAQRSAVIILFAVNFVAHFAWSPLFFKYKRPDLALIEVMFLWISCLLLCIILRPISVTASWLVAPYLAWVSFAAVLNLAIVRLNPRRNSAT